MYKGKGFIHFMLTSNVLVCLYPVISDNGRIRERSKNNRMNKRNKKCNELDQFPPLTHTWEYAGDRIEPPVSENV